MVEVISYNDQLREHGGSFGALDIPRHLQPSFEKYKAWAVQYYEE